MMDSISWGEFLKGLGTVLIFYYGYVFIRFFCLDFSGLLKRFNRRGLPSLPSGIDSYDGAMDKVGLLISEIDQEIIPTSESAEELIAKLRSKLIRSEITLDPVVSKILVSHIQLATKLKGLSITEEDLENLFGLSQH